MERQRILGDALIQLCAVLKCNEKKVWRLFFFSLMSVFLYENLFYSSAIYSSRSTFLSPVAYKIWPWILHLNKEKLISPTQTGRQNDWLPPGLWASMQAEKAGIPKNNLWPNSCPDMINGLKAADHIQAPDLLRTCGKTEIFGFVLRSWNRLLWLWSCFLWELFRETLLSWIIKVNKFITNPKDKNIQPKPNWGPHGFVMSCLILKRRCLWSAAILRKNEPLKLLLVRGPRDCHPCVNIHLYILSNIQH